VAIAYPVSSLEFSGGRVDIALGGPKGLGSPTSLVGSGDSQGAFGWRVAAGDFDGDGYGDVVVGATGEANQLGRLYLFRGSPQGIRSSPAWTYTASVRSIEQGLFAAFVGSADFNGDGFDDLVAVNVDGGLLVFNGNPSTFLGAPIAIAPLRTSTPSAVSASQDLNGDGFGDVIVGFESEGLASILFGSAGGLTSSGALSLGAETSGFGQSISR
jgi:hypothetical protein